MNIARFCGLVLLGIVIAPVAIGTVAAFAEDRPADHKTRLEIGRELFTREWVAGDKRSLAGDGLGPVFNERSCAKCHMQGGVGGSGPRINNVGVMSVFVDLSTPRFSFGASLEPADSNPAVKQPARSKLAALHPALLTDSSFPIHRFGVDKSFEKWKAVNHIPGDERAKVRLNNQTIDGVRIALVRSDRNTPALFGSGLLNQIQPGVLEAIEAEQAKAASKVKQEDLRIPDQERNGRFALRQPLAIAGRVSRLKDGKIGRFGWKGNVATLAEFTLQACANELGLEVPGVSRAVPPWIPNYKAPGLDLSADQCACLTEFVASLPRPVAPMPTSKKDELEISQGAKLFANLGCATCHRPNLGEIAGVYSDLLLHDMGQSLSGSGFYGTNIDIVKTAGLENPLPVNRDSELEAKREKPPQFGASTREWRTPPLWGLRDSAPYLHDGRADTSEDAIKLHDGEGALAAHAFEKLTPRERMQLDMFLKSLAAPEARP
jgi:CxxC motif-containing protein (DUF1111 family)